MMARLFLGTRVVFAVGVAVDDGGDGSPSIREHMRWKDGGDGGDRDNAHVV